MLRSVLRLRGSVSRFGAGRPCASAAAVEANMATHSLVDLKKAARKQMKQILKEMPLQDMQQESEALTSRTRAEYSEDTTPCIDTPNLQVLLSLMLLCVAPSSSSASVSACMLRVKS